MNTRAGKTKGLLTNIRGRLRGPHSTRWGRTGRLRKLVPALPWIGLFAAIVLALLAITQIPPLISPDLDDPQAQFEVRNEAFRTVAAIIGGVVVLFGVFINWRRVSALERQVTTLQLGQITERFTRAIDQLGAVRPDNEPAPQIRAGGVRSLERIAGESVEDRWPILDILTAYLRSELPVPEPDYWDAVEDRLYEARNRMDVAFAVDSIQRLWPSQGEVGDAQLNVAHAFLPRLSLPGKHLEGANLRGAYLRDANLRGANLRGANLELANLERADLDGANLWGADLRSAVLSGGRLVGADLRGASLRTANLQDAYLPLADLDEANLQSADLDGAVLWGASLRHTVLSYASLAGVDLKGSDLRGTNLAFASLEGATLRRARYDDDTQWPEGFAPPPSA